MPALDDLRVKARQHEAEMGKLRAQYQRLEDMPAQDAMEIRVRKTAIRSRYSDVCRRLDEVTKQIRQAEAAQGQK